MLYWDSLKHIYCLWRSRSIGNLISQVNTQAAEVLYTAIGEWAQLSQESTVLDICCGTGTIGISLAKVGNFSSWREAPFYPFLTVATREENTLYIY